MRLLTGVQSFSVAATTGSVSSYYSESSVQDDYPSHGWISSDITDTLTVNYTAGADSMFLGHVIAETVEITFNDSNTTTYTFSNRIDWNRIYFRGRKKLANDLWVEVPATSTSATIELTNAVDVKEEILYFLSNGTDGYLSATSNGSEPILFTDYPQLRVGTTLVHSGGSSQIKELKGIGTGTGDVVLFSGGSSAFTITSIKLPISVGVIRLGTKTQLPNPTIGFAQSSQDYGVRRENYGTLLYTPKDFVRSFTVPIRLSKTQLDTFNTIWDGYRGQPLGVDLLESVDTTKTGFMTLANPPEITANLRRYSLFDASFELREVG